MSFAERTLAVPQEFLETVTVVLEAVEEPPPPRRRAPGALAGREQSPQLLRFVTPNSNTSEDGDREPKAAAGARSRRTGRDLSAPIESTKAAPLTIKGGDQGAAPAAAAGTPNVSAAAADYARCRTRLAGWLFRPLLSDAFALASLTQALSLLGLGGGDGQAAVLIRDMAAWFLALPVGRAADTTVGREAQNCPVLRWLKGVILAWASPPPPPPPLPSKRSARDHGGATTNGEKSFLDEKAAPAAAARTGRRRVADLFEDPDDGGANATASAAATSSAEKGGIFGDDEAPLDAEVSDTEREQGDDEASEEEEEANEDGDVVCDQGPGSSSNSSSSSSSSKDLQARAEEILRPMFEACAASQCLENAAMLSVVAAEALAACREKLEESSLGQVAIGGGEAWVTLARRLRLCLFVDHRLHWGVRAEKRWGRVCVWAWTGLWGTGVMQKR